MSSLNLCRTDGAARGELSSLRLSRVATEVDVVIVSRLEHRSFYPILGEFNSEPRDMHHMALMRAVSITSMMRLDYLIPAHKPQSERDLQSHSDCLNRYLSDFIR